MRLLVLSLLIVIAGCSFLSIESSSLEVPLGSLWYPVYGYDRTTGGCQGGLGSAAWTDGGPPVLVTPWRGFYGFGYPCYR